MSNTLAYSAASATSPLESTTIPRREPGERDVEIEILFCGICHSDVHQVRNEWSGLMPTVYPVVPGHEIVGRVSRVGSAVTAFKLSDIVGVGCLVDSDRTCPQCRAGYEQFCPNLTLTFNSPDKHLGGVTCGGYSKSIVVDEHFVLRVPSNLDLAGVAPLLCAGVTTYSPMRHWDVGTGKKVGVVGLGGLGHMGVKFAHAFGARVVVFTTSPDKKADALRLGADEVVISSNATRCRSTPRASTLFSIPFPPITTSTGATSQRRRLVVNGTHRAASCDGARTVQPPRLGELGRHLTGETNLAAPLFGSPWQRTDIQDPVRVR